MAVQLGSDDPTQEFDAIVEKYNTNIHDFLLKLPGISSKNINAVMKKGENMKNLLKLSQVRWPFIFQIDIEFIYETLVLGSTNRNVGEFQER